ncbi:Pre-mRNA-splicing factor cwc26 [Ophidiomyces ophidiicola]|nr:Pre-mRNA-splicing factor cwc26 [Ophidiomyces ophidiicola]KAI2008771.1 Pre-mRNA-splicing factor cwc26 [Ophidiomyces ophidiicola]KAI2070037.1 Pre-mRNA-splicing factor cwc26 [Ophidiomyces ophidiicola]KAI2133358.1 Pre-mRNA-splicing factor cwc26 [Ophidiomyces ophidiicola]KAI2138225.1 Pre-mRNA-splicing factor cwc26 [Ophidiomyces ophidiicola]
MSLADYLAKKYLTADSLPTPDRPKKKRKKNKHAEQSAGGHGLIIADDDPPDLRSTTAGEPHSRREFGDDDELGYTVAGPSREFKKSQSKWKTVSGPTAPSSAEQMAADAVLASAAAERAAQNENDDEKPLVVENDEPDDADGEAALRMQSGARAGLQTAAQTAAMVAAQARKHAKDAASLRSKAAKGADAETIYRDASGRIINVAMKRAEARKAAEDAAAKAAAEKEALTGDVQRQERAERRKMVEEAKFMPLARTADDEEMNDELRARERWNDPAAQFLTKPTKRGGARGAGAGPAKKVYEGAAPPNRYGIRPGHRWDGVDRGNGFERQWFDARNRRERNEGLAYAWQMDE